MKSSALLAPVLMAALAGITESALSIPLESDVVRAAAVAAKSLTIDNSPRLHPVGDRTYPYIHGPKPAKPSLHYANFIKQAIVINTTENANASRIQNILAENGPYSSPESFLRGYKLVEEAGLIDRPQAVDNSDECFGAMRLSIRGHNLQLVREGEYSNYLESLPESLLLELCNAQSIGEARQLNHIFVQDFSGYRNFTDESASEEKYAPNVLGFFCFNDETGKLMPLAITLLDTGLTYTKLDSGGEWQLAKMALDATELNYQQMRHLVETHLMSIPIQVEMIRSMDERHPIYALLDYHFFGDLALEALGGKILFSRGSPYDRSMAFGAGGSMRYIVAEFERHTLEDDLPTIIEKRGLNNLPNHRYVRYGTAYYSAIKAFVTAYIKTYYESDEAVQRDMELQTWATRSAEVPEIHGFPSKLASIDTLVKLVTHLVFQNAVKHHFMNGIVSWHSQAAPFSTPAIFGSMPLPTVKGVEVNPLDYAIPSDVFPLLSYMAARFHRPIPRKFSLLEAYVGAPFDGEPQLAQHIKHFHQLMELLEVYVDNMESKEEFPFPFVKPSLMPWFSYI